MKYTPGLVVGQLSGKAGSTVASRNKAGSYLKTKTTPKLVRNPLTEAVRTSLAAISSAWRALTDVERAAWASLGASIPRTDSLGNSYTLTGAQAHELVNRNLFTIGLPYTPTAPALSDPGAPSSIGGSGSAVPSGSTTVTTGATSATQTLGSTTGLVDGAVLTFATGSATRIVVTVDSPTQVTLDSSITTTTAEGVSWAAQTPIDILFFPSPVPADTYLQIQMTAPLSAGVTRPGRSQFRSMFVLNPGDVTNVSADPQYSSRFGPAPTGSRVYVAASYISSTGFQGQRITQAIDIH